MKFFLYVYHCHHCNTKYEVPELLGAPYGEFLMRSDSGAVAYLSSFEDIVFDEVGDVFKNNSSIIGEKIINTISIFHKVFSLSCDSAPDGSTYKISNLPHCPQCGKNDYLSWCPTKPLKLFDGSIGVVTHSEWNSLSYERKIKKINEAIDFYLKKV